MAHYLIQGNYTAEAWKALVTNPQDRLEVVRVEIEKLGGRLDSGWFAFGDRDIILITEFPDNVSAAALSMAFCAGGGFKAQTIPLMTIAEGIQAMKKAAKLAYRAPGK